MKSITEEVLLAELERANHKVYALTNALRKTRSELKEVRREYNKLIHENKKRKQHYRNGQKRGRNGFNG